MTCTAHCCAIDGLFDRRVAQRDLERYRRKGPSPSTRRLLSLTRQAGIAGATVLDVGGGIGAIAHEMLDEGAERATLVEASAAYLSAARDEVARRDAAARLQLLSGDFASLAKDIPIADVVMLDKVVCCYPDMDGLLGSSTGRTRRLFGIVYPRDVWWLRMAMVLVNAVQAARRNAFRIYVFPNAAIDSAIRRAGLALRTEQRGFVWVVALYERSNPAR